MLTHRNLASNIAQVLANPRRPRDLEEVVLAVLPLFHVFGLNTVLGVALRVGGTAVLVERFDPRATLEAIRRHRVTVVTGVPTMWSAWADLEGAPADAFASVRRSEERRVGKVGRCRGAAQPARQRCTSC